MKNCLFGVTDIIKHNFKSKYRYGSYGIAFDFADSWSFGNGFARNNIVFGIDYSSSSHSDNRKNKILVLDEGLTANIDGSVGIAEKKFSIRFSKQRHNFA